MTERQLVIGDVVIRSPSTKQIEYALENLGASSDGDLFATVGSPDGDDWLTIYSAAEYGFYLSGSEEGGNGYRTAVTSRDETEETVELFLAGNTGRYQRRAFLSFADASRIVSHFVATGRFLPDILWVDAEDVMGAD